MSIIHVGNDTFEINQDRMEVTSIMPRPDLNWVFVDANGHEHRWLSSAKCEACDAGMRLVDKIHYNELHGGATWGICRKLTYHPGSSYSTPSLKWVKTGEEYWEDDDEPHDVGHLACLQCDEKIEPGTMIDPNVYYIAGLKTCRINGQVVRSYEEFMERFRTAVNNATDGEIRPDSDV